MKSKLLQNFTNNAYEFLIINELISNDYKFNKYLKIIAHISKITKDINKSLTAHDSIVMIKIAWDLEL